MEDYIDKIVQKLEFMNIGKIITIDDEWENDISVNMEDDITRMIEDIHPQNMTEIQNKISNMGYTKVSDVYENKDQELIDIIEDDAKRKQKKSPDLEKLENILQDLESKGINIERFSEFSTELFDSCNENCLFILDKEMDENDDIVKDSIPPILENAKEKDLNHLILTYSNNISDEYSSNQKKLEYVKSYMERSTSSDCNLYIYKMFAIKKGEEELCKKINDVILDGIYGDALYNYMTIKEEEHNEVYEMFCKYDNDQISQVAADNFFEGCSLDSSIEILEKALKRKNSEKYSEQKKSVLEKFNLYQNENIQRIVSENEEKSNSKFTKFRNDCEEDKLKRVLDSEIVLWEKINYSINKSYNDISTGDIFCIKMQDKINRFLIIVENKCDCIIRMQKNVKDIKRKTKEKLIKNLEFQFVEVDKERMVEFKDDIKSEETIFPVQIFDKIGYLKLLGEEIYFFELLMDICSLSENGEYKKEINKDAVKYKSYYFNEYLNSNIELLNTLNEISEESKQKVIEMIPEQIEQNKIILPSQIKRDENDNMEIIRIGRVNYEDILRICQKKYEKELDEGKNKFPKDSLTSTELIIPVKDKN